MAAMNMRASREEDGPMNATAPVALPDLGSEPDA